MEEDEEMEENSDIECLAIACIDPVTGAEIICTHNPKYRKQMVVI